MKWKMDQNEAVKALLDYSSVAPVVVGAVTSIGLLTQMLCSHSHMVFVITFTDDYFGGQKYWLIIM